MLNNNQRFFPKKQFRRWIGDHYRPRYHGACPFASIQIYWGTLAGCATGVAGQPPLATRPMIG